LAQSQHKPKATYRTQRRDRKETESEELPKGAARFGCPKGSCNMTFSQQKDAERHGETVEGCRDGENQFSCDTCGRSFSRKDALVRHNKSDSHLKRVGEFLDSEVAGEH
jgi:uncharacterized C2H2 Zn-finger protein